MLLKLVGVKDAVETSLKRFVGVWGFFSVLVNHDVDTVPAGLTPAYNLFRNCGFKGMSNDWLTCFWGLHFILFGTVIVFAGSKLNQHGQKKTCRPKWG